MKWTDSLKISKAQAHGPQKNRPLDRHQEEIIMRLNYHNLADEIEYNLREIVDELEDTEAKLEEAEQELEEKEDDILDLRAQLKEAQLVIWDIKQHIEEDTTDEPLEKRLLRECRRLEKEKGISAFVRQISDETARPKQTTTKQRLHVEGLDQAGIVYKISRYLADNYINISNFESRMTYSPQTGAKIYTIDIQIEVPTNFTNELLDEGLNQIGNELNVDISVGGH